MLTTDYCYRHAPKRPSKPPEGTAGAAPLSRLGALAGLASASEPDSSRGVEAGFAMATFGGLASADCVSLFVRAAAALVVCFVLVDATFVFSGAEGVL